MIYSIAYAPFGGLSVVAYSGIITLTFFIFTATVGFLNYHKIRIIPFAWHPWLALTSLLLAVVHAVLALSIYFNY